MLIEFESVMRNHPELSGPQFYLFTSDDGERQLWVPAEDWEEMGEPAVVTVLVRPGDRLNKEDGDE